MAKVQIKSEKLTPFGGIFSIMEKFDPMLSPVIDSTLGQRCRSRSSLCSRTKKVFQRKQHIASVVFSSAIVYSYLSVLYGKNGLRREFLTVSPRIRYDNRCDDRQKTEHIRSISLKTLKIAGFLPAKSNE